MALQLCSQAARFSPPALIPIETSFHLLWRLKLSKHAVGLGGNRLPSATGWPKFLGVERCFITPNMGSYSNPRKSGRLRVSASVPLLLPTSVQVASRLFTFGTAFVVPFYTVMILAPHASFTKKLINSSFPYAVLGILYVYLLFLSWSPETLPSMFASKYWLPELPGITKMFSSTLTVASAWLHLLAVDLFAGRHIYLDGLQESIETRHSLILCLLFCPIGMLSHFFTKAVFRLLRRASSQEVADVATLYS